MGLQSALSTALTGLTAAETSIDVIGNNVANANTVGFKESEVSFATQFLQTQSIGSAPTANTGGTNPRQTGLGVKVAEISPNFTQGTIEISSNPLDLAIQGDGFFMVQGSQGETLYTRNGQFKTNSRNEIVTINGQRVLGFGVDENYEIQATQLVPITIPLGASAVAQATENVTITGELNPNGTIGSIPEVIRSGILSDGSKDVPSASAITTTAIAAPQLQTAAATEVAVPAGAVDTGGVFSYRFVFVDANGNEGPPSLATSSVTVAGATSTLRLNNIPQPGSGSGLTQVRIYRSDSSATDTAYREVTTLAAGITTFDDGASNASIAAAPTLDAQNLTSGSYSYYVTYYSSVTGEESRPTARIGPITADSVTSPRIRLDNLPTPPPGDFDGIRIYRNLSNESSDFRRLAQFSPSDLAALPPGPVSYIDNSPDAAIASAQAVNLEGPPISFGLSLLDVVSRTDSNYVNLFQAGTLTFAGSKGDRVLGARSLEIDAQTTVGELIDFMEQSFGIVQDADEDTFPAGNFGGDIIDSRLQFTSNMGIENALSVNLSAFQLTPTGGAASTVPLAFNSSQAAETNGEGATTNFIVYDSLGTPVSVRVTTVLESSNGTDARFRWIATSADNDPDDGVGTVVGTGLIITDGEGRFVSATNDRVAVDRTSSPAASPLEFQLDFSQISGLDSGANQIQASEQDGFPAGTLSSFIISDSGRIVGLFTNGSTRDLGQLRMARFANNSGLEQRGENLFAAGVNSGLPVEGDPGSQGIGQIKAGAVELSNADIGQNLIELILASTQYRGGARVITAVQQLFDELLALRR